MDVRGRQTLVLVDGQNLLHALHSLGARIDLDRFRAWVNAYDGWATVEWFQGRHERATAFLNAAKAHGFRVHTRAPKPAGNGWTADMDVALAVRAMELADSYDTVILVSGDGDFEPLVACLVRRGTRVVVLQLRAMTSPELIQHVEPHDFVDLADAIGSFGLARQTA